MSEDVKTALEQGLAEIKTELDASIAAHTAESLETGKQANTELTGRIDELSHKFEEMQNEITDMAQKQTPAIPGEAAPETAGDIVVNSEQYKALASGQREKFRLEVKTTTINSNLQAVFGDNTTVFPNQRPGVIAGDFVPLTVRSRMNEIPVSTDAVNALRESSWTSTAAETAQGALKPESTINFEQYNVAIETIAHWIKVTNRLLADAPAIAAYINTRLRDGLAQRVENQLLNGNGTSPNISGLTDAGNFTAFSPAPNANLVDSINKAKYEMWATGHTPDTVIVNPADWGAMEREREGVGSGMYLYGTPGTVGSSSPFGIPVVMSTYMAQGSFIIASLGTITQIYNRQSAVVEMGYVDDDFTRNLVTIRAEERLALSVDNPSGVLFGDIAVS